MAEIERKRSREETGYGRRKEKVKEGFQSLVSSSGDADIIFIA
jgi:hypothetical protein